MEVFLIKTLQFLLAISLLVLLHELGHFTFAKLFKVRVSRFYLFFNPKFHIMSTYDARFHAWLRSGEMASLQAETLGRRHFQDRTSTTDFTKLCFRCLPT